MTLGKQHLMLTIPIFVAAMAYNIWYFTRTEDVVTARPAIAESAAAPAQAGPRVADDVSPAPVDPTEIPPVTDVVLGRAPQWTRNPFVNLQAPPPAPVADAGPMPAAAPAPEAELVVSMIAIDRRPRARVNGKTVYVGDRIGTSTVVAIEQKAIVVESPTGGRRTIVQQRRPSSREAAATP